MKQLIINKTNKELVKETKKIIQLYCKIQRANYECLVKRLKLKDKELKKTLYYYLFSVCDYDIKFE